MNTAQLSAHSVSLPPLRRHLTLVASAEPERTPPSPGAGLAALTGGLATGFALAAVGTVMGGGDPMTSLRLAALCAVGALASRISARRMRRGRPAPRSVQPRPADARRSAPQHLRRAA